MTVLVDARGAGSRHVAVRGGGAPRAATEIGVLLFHRPLRVNPRPTVAYPRTSGVRRQARVAATRHATMWNTLPCRFRICSTRLPHRARLINSRTLRVSAVA